MLEAKAIKNQDYWYQQFGLYPMLMKPKICRNKFLMLNGGNKDFCLQTDSINNGGDKFFSESWSTNTKNYLVINNDIVSVYNWENNDTHNYKLEYIENSPNKFYSYLSEKSYKTPNDVVPYIMSIFRELRNLTGKEEPIEALNLLFKLLISIEEDYTKIDSSKWGITDTIVPSIVIYLKFL